MDPVTDKYEINYSIKLPFYIKMSAFHFPNSNPLLIQLVPESLVFDKSSHLLGILAQKEWRTLLNIVTTPLKDNGRVNIKITKV